MITHMFGNYLFLNRGGNTFVYAFMWTRKFKVINFATNQKIRRTSHVRHVTLLDDIDPDNIADYRRGDFFMLRNLAFDWKND